jgi:hypothetical protein
MFYTDPNSLIIEEIGRRVWPANKTDTFNLDEKGWEIQIKNNLDEAFHRHWFKQNYVSESEKQRTDVTHH